MAQIGMGPASTWADNEYKLSDHGIKIAVTIDKTAADSGGVAGKLRKGLVLGRVTETGKFKQYDDTAEDGTATAVAILDDEASLVDASGAACDAQSSALIHGYVAASALFGIDANGKADLAHVIFG